MIDPAKMIVVARQPDSGIAGRPPVGEAVRRAVSGAYYAFFHTLLKEGAERFVGVGNMSVAFETIYRGFDHAKINKIFVAIDQQTLSDTYKDVSDDPRSAKKLATSRLSS